jgi:hypothetical protein
MRTLRVGKKAMPDLDRKKREREEVVELERIADADGKDSAEVDWRPRPRDSSFGRLAQFPLRRDVARRAKCESSWAGGMAPGLGSLRVFGMLPPRFRK